MTSPPSRRWSVDPLLLSDEVEHLIDDAQEAHLNGYPRDAQAKLNEAIRLLAKLAVDGA